MTNRTATVGLFASLCCAPPTCRYSSCRTKDSVPTNRNSLDAVLISVPHFRGVTAPFFLCMILPKETGHDMSKQSIKYLIHDPADSQIRCPFNHGVVRTIMSTDFKDAPTKEPTDFKDVPTNNSTRQVSKKSVGTSNVHASGHASGHIK